MSTYVPITIEDMRPLFQKTDSKGNKWHEGIEGKSEIVFDFLLSANCIVRVWTSCYRGIAAGKGKDAIRVCAFDPILGKGLVKASRVYRTKNWRDNLKTRVYEVFAEARKRAKWNRG